MAKSKWVTLRDGIVAALDLENITEEMKQNATNALLEQVLPNIFEAADKLSERLKADAKNEKGWCAIRDAFIFPMLISGAQWAIKTGLERAKATAVVEASEKK